MIDSTITPNFKKRVLEEVKDAICLGISLVTGPMIRETVDIAHSIKAWNPDFPIILGGWHPSLLPKQTLECECIDIVVRGQGEETLLELVQHIESRSAIDLVPGIGFKRDGKLIFTPERPLRPLAEMPPKAYHLADFDAYERTCGRRWAMYTSSLACPFNCAYCTNAGVYGRKWNALPPSSLWKKRWTLPVVTTWKCCGWWTTTSSSILIARGELAKGWCVRAQTSSGVSRRPRTWWRGCRWKI